MDLFTGWDPVMVDEYLNVARRGVSEQLVLDLRRQASDRSPVVVDLRRSKAEAKTHRDR